jgi:hypothetical protein
LIILGCCIPSETLNTLLLLDHTFFNFPVGRKIGSLFVYTSIRARRSENRRAAVEFLTPALLCVRPKRTRAAERRLVYSAEKGKMQMRGVNYANSIYSHTAPLNESLRESPRVLCVWAGGELRGSNLLVHCVEMALRNSERVCLSAVVTFRHANYHQDR